MPDLLALLDVKLRSGPVAGGDHRDHRAAIIGSAPAPDRIGARKRIAMHEVGMVAGNKPSKEGCAPDRIPARSSPFAAVAVRADPSARSRPRSSRSPA